MSNLWDDWNDPQNRKLREMYAEQDRKMQAQDVNRDAADLAAARAENVRLREALRDVIQLAQVSFDGDPYYAKQADLDGDAILNRASAALAAAPAGA